MKYCEDEWDETPTHSLLLGSKFQSLCLGGSEEYLLGNPLAHEIGQLGRDVQSMPQSAKMVQRRCGGVSNGIQTRRVRRNVVVEVVSDNRRFVIGYQRLP
jgi:hypothetical protein